MSATEIYAIGKDHCTHIGDAKNAWRGAMFVWNQIAIDYFKLDGFPHFDLELQKRVWNAHSSHPLTDAEMIVLTSTMDDVSVKPKDVDRLLAAFDKYAADHPQSSIGDQAELIRAFKLKEDSLIVWNQTSINCFKYEPEEGEDGLVYEDISPLWDLFEQFDSIKSEKSQGAT